MVMLLLLLLLLLRVRGLVHSQDPQSQTAEHRAGREPGVVTSSLTRVRRDTNAKAALHGKEHDTSYIKRKGGVATWVGQAQTRAGAFGIVFKVS